MNETFKFSKSDDRQIVYVRPVALDELPEEVREHAEGQDHVYALHSETGDRLALVRDRKLAFALARQNDMAPANVH